MRALSLMTVCLVLCFSAAPAMGQIDSFFDVFWVDIEGTPSSWNQQITGGGSGYPSLAGGPEIGEWFEYDAVPGSQIDGFGAPNPSLTPTWWNEWFYDGNLRLDRYKVVDLAFDYSLIDPAQPGSANVVINWSTDLYNNGSGAPPMTNEFIGRYEVNVAWDDIGGPGGNYANSFDLRELGCPYNPEWVSIDVSGYNISIIGGTFNHFCIPEPGTIVLLITAGLGLLLYAWRRRK